MRRYIVIITLMLYLFMSIVSAQEMTIPDKTVGIEKLFYGSEQIGSVTDRVGKLEQDLYGINSQDPVVTKLDTIYSYTMKNSNSSPSFVTKLNVVEWALTHSVAAKPVSSRLDNLEHIMAGGTVTTGSYDGRLASLTKLVYPDGQFSIASQLVPKDTLVKIETVSPLDSRQNKVGDTIMFQVVDDVYVNGMLIITKGAQGIGEVTNVEHAKNYGRDAKIEIRIDSINAVDGSLLNVALVDKEKDEIVSLPRAAGASVAGMAILGPIGVVGGVFVEGKEKNISIGTIMHVKILADTTLYGIPPTK